MSIESPSSPGVAVSAEATLRELERLRSSGVLEFTHPRDEVSHVWLRDGLIYAVNVPGYRPALGIRLLSGGLLSPEQLSAAIAEQRRALTDQRIGEVLVRLGFVTAEAVDGFVLEQVHDQVADLLDMPIISTSFHPGRRIRQDTIAPSPVDTILTLARERRARWATVLAEVGGSFAVPTLGPQGRGTTAGPLGPHDWALLCRVDGRRDITELARVCGFTVLEAAQVVCDLAHAGLLVIPRTEHSREAAALADVVALHPTGSSATPQWRFADANIGEPEPVLSVPAPAPAPAASGSSIGLTPGADTAAEPGPAWDWSSSPLLAEFSEFLSDPSGPAEPVPDAAPGQDSATTADAADDDALAHDPIPHDPTAQAPSVEAPGDVAADVVVEAGPDLGPEPGEPRVDAGAMQPGASADGSGVADLPGSAGTDEEATATSGLVPMPPVLAATATPGAGPARTPPSAGPEAAAPTGPAANPAFPYSDTSVFMRELSSLSGEPDQSPPTTVTRRVIPLTEQRRKRLHWGR